ncbi:hypothetical protein Misp01_10700 [Microtetraspora sp. NBRC 13810]|nr:hypothetical protein Misp01_10700 [Microtetraspora sp. NBRC 13810]
MAAGAGPYRRRPSAPGRRAGARIPARPGSGRPARAVRGASGRGGLRRRWLDRSCGILCYSWVTNAESVWLAWKEIKHRAASRTGAVRCSTGPGQCLGARPARE